MTTAKVEWDIIGEEVASCNCDWGCPCQFNALPTKGFCEALVGLRIEHGHFGSTSLDGVIYAQLVHFDGPVHAGNGHRLLVIDEKSSPEGYPGVRGRNWRTCWTRPASCRGGTTWSPLGT